MRPVYKKVKTVAEHCPTCGERLSGNNSINSLWECRCGVWVAVKYPFTGEYEIQPRLDLGAALPNRKRGVPPNRKEKPQRWSRKGRCPGCDVGSGSKHRPECTFDYGK